MNKLFERYLRQHKIKLTPPRREVFGVLERSGPLTMRELIARVSGRADRASIYRTIAIFEHLGIVHHLILGGRRVIELTDSFSRHHHHLTCTDCGRPQAIHDERLEKALHEMIAAHGFEATSHLIEVSGRCQNCIARRAAE